MSRSRGIGARREIDRVFAGLEPLEQRTLLSAVLATPIGLTASAQSPSAVQLAWRSSTSAATGFLVLRSIDGQAFSQVAQVVGASATSYKDTTVASNHTYRYQLEAYNAGNVSLASAPVTVTTPLASPSGLTASLSSRLISLAWTDNDSAATGYYVLRSVDGGTFTVATNITSAVATTFTDSAIVSGHTYAYEVQAYTTLTKSAASAAAAVTTPLTAPSALAASTTGTYLKLTWTDNDLSASGYYVLRSTDGKTFTRVATIRSANAASYTDSTVAPSQTYQYQVQAYDAVTTSVASGAAGATTPMGVPSAVTLTLAGGSVKLAWRNVDATVTGYYVFASMDGQASTQIATITSGATTSYTDNSVSTGHVYSYTVTAYGASRTSAASAPASIVTPLVSPSQVTVAASGASTQLTWTDNDANATGYYILRSIDGRTATRLTTINSAAAASYTDSNTPSGHIYAYQIQAFNGVATSPASASAAATVPLAAPASVSATLSGTSVSLAWTGADANALGYYVLRSADGKTFTKIATVTGVTNVKYADQTASGGTLYSYQVQAYCGTVVSAASAIVAVTTPMAAPTGVTATATAGSVLLRWTRNSSATGYLVLRSTDGQNYSQVAQISSGATVSWTDAATAAGNSYYYEVEAYNTIATSSASAPVQVTTPASSDTSGGVTIGMRYTNELVITGSGANDTITVDQNGSGLLVTADGKSFSYSIPAAGVFIYARGGSDVITTTTALTVRTTIVSIDGAPTTINSAAVNVSAWIDSTDTFSGSGKVHKVTSFAGGVSKAVGVSLADPSDAGTTKKVNLSLWGAGPVAGDENQGSVGDCYFMATLAAFAGTNPSTLRESAVDMGDGTYVVQYYRSNQAVFVRVNNDFSTGGFAGGFKYGYAGANNAIWAMVMEKAWAYFRTGANTYASTNAGWMGSVYTALGVNNSDFTPPSYNQSDLYAAISTALASGHPVTFACMSGPDLVNGHAYTLVSASKDASGTAHYVVRNPWGSSGDALENSGGYATLTYAQLIANFQYGTWAA